MGDVSGSGCPSGGLLDIKGLCKRYPDFALEEVDLTVPSGSVVGFIGANGAGKTTTIRAALGLVPVTSGSIEMFGEPVGLMTSADETAAKQRVGVVFDACAFPGEVRLKDVACMMETAYACWDRQAFAERLDQFELPLGRKVSELSRGMGMKLMLAIALCHAADLLILDEATAGLDPLAREEVLDVLRGFMEEQGHGILMSSHITSDLEKIADYIVCIDAGRIVFSCEKDSITDAAGIARCRTAQFETLSQSSFFAPGGLRYLRHGYGIDVLVDDRARFTQCFGDIAVDRATIDEYMALRLKGEVR